MALLLFSTRQTKTRINSPPQTVIFFLTSSTLHGFENSALTSVRYTSKNSGKHQTVLNFTTALRRSSLNSTMSTVASPKQHNGNSRRNEINSAQTSRKSRIFPKRDVNSNSHCATQEMSLIQSDNLHVPVVHLHVFSSLEILEFFRKVWSIYLAFIQV